MSESAENLFQKLKTGDRGALSRGITIMESIHVKDHKGKMDLLSECDKLDNNAVRIAVTGAPGVGKSSLIELMGMSLIDAGHKVAVLAIDPSSERTGGSILGDKTRMPNLSRHENAFIRPSPTSGILGGIAAATRESILLCEAAGYDRIIVETVGVGQSETRVSTLTDVVVFVTITGSGDALQGIKRGVLEVIDVVAVNKSDGQNVVASTQFATQLGAALHLLHGANAPPLVTQTSAIEKTGIETLLENVANRIETARSEGVFEQRRKRQRQDWFKQAITLAMNRSLREMTALSDLQAELANKVQDKQIHPYVAADQLVSAWLSKH